MRAILLALSMIGACFLLLTANESAVQSRTRASPADNDIAREHPFRLMRGQSVSLAGAVMVGESVTFCATFSDFKSSMSDGGRPCPSLARFGWNGIVNDVNDSMVVASGMHDDAVREGGTAVEVTAHGHTGWTAAGALIPLLPAGTRFTVRTMNNALPAIWRRVDVATSYFAQLSDQTLVSAISQKGFYYQVKVLGGPQTGRTGWV
jgi:hypothetical protein